MVHGVLVDVAPKGDELFLDDAMHVKSLSLFPKYEESKHVHTKYNGALVDCIYGHQNRNNNPLKY